MQIKWEYKKCIFSWGFSLVLTGSEKGLVVGSCEHDNNYSDSMDDWEIHQ
jgi:hypothetical protein